MLDIGRVEMQTSTKRTNKYKQGQKVREVEDTLNRGHVKFRKY